LTLNSTLTLAGTDSTTITFQGTDTYVGRSTTDTLTNKTLSAPTINGTVSTTGLTIPAFTLSGNLMGSGAPVVSGLGTINGLTFSSASDGLTISGGTTSRILTLTGADLTLGSTIKPTSAGSLTIQSNGSSTLTIDTGAAATLNFGNTNASSLVLGNSGSTLNLNGNFDMSGSSGTFKTGTGAVSLNGTATVAAGKTLSVTDADKLTVGGKVIPQAEFIHVQLLATVVTQPVFIADTTYQVTGAKCDPSIASTSGTFQVTVESGTTAPGSGTAQLTGAVSLSGTANTVVSGTLAASPTTLNAGDRISAVFGGVLTGLVGTCTIYLKRV
jgi:hypothetical protein